MSSNQVKLYESAGSPNSRRVRIFLAEKGVSIARVPVDLGAREQFSDAYVKINPRRVVPTLVLEDGTAIGEVPAIMRCCCFTRHSGLWRSWASSHSAG